MAAITALKIGENPLVDNIADFGAGHGTSCATEQAAEDRSRKTAEQHAGRTTDSTDGCTGLGTGQRTTGTCCGTTDCTDRAADPSGGVETIDIARLADGTFVTHGFFS